MKKVLIVVITLLILVMAGLTLKQTVLKPKVAGIQVKSTPQSTVFINGKSVGQTPFEDKKLNAGEISLKLVPDSTTATLSPWETKVKLVSGTQTFITREFGEDEAKSTFETMTLEKISDKKKASLLVISQPDSVMARLNGEAKGFTPYSLEKVDPKDFEIVLSSSGFAEYKTKVKLLPGYKLILNIKMKQEAQSTEEENQEGQEADKVSPTPTPKGAKVTPTPTPTPKTSITPKPTPKTTPKIQLEKPYVTIKETPTGWLRVRSEASTQSTEVAKVNPGESYAYLDQKSGWYKIAYQEGKAGWISGQYAEKFE